MTATGNLQAALAHLMVDDAARHQLHCDPDSLARRFGLTAAQLASLQSIDPGRLELATRIGRSKRLNFVSRGLPATCQALHLTGRHAVLHDFGRVTQPRVETEAASRTRNESRRFVGYLRGLGSGIAEWIGELAGYELMRLELFDSAEASLSTRRVAQLDPVAVASADPSTVFVTGPHVRVQQFTYDVVDLTARVEREDLALITPVATVVAVVKRPTAPFLSGFRIGSAVAVVLRHCATPRSIAELRSVIGQYDSCEIESVIDNVLSAGMLLPHNSDVDVAVAAG